MIEPPFFVGYFYVYSKFLIFMTNIILFLSLVCATVTALYLMACCQLPALPWVIFSTYKVLCKDTVATSPLSCLPSEVAPFYIHAY